MIEWSESDLLIREAVREFIDRDLRPNIDALESGDMPPYPIIRKLFSEFGLDVIASEAVKNMLDRERAREHDGEKSDGRSPGLGSVAEQASMAAIMISELAGVSLGLVAAMGVSLRLGPATIIPRRSHAR